MKRLFPIILILALLLSGCGAYTPIEATPTPQAREDYTFTAETVPDIVCAPSLLPLGEAVGAALLGLTREAGAKYASSAVTAKAWQSALEGGVTLAPDTGEVKGVRTAEIARDALVFFVSAGNRVDSLTQAQIADIFGGKITNWKEVGGADEEIVLFVKNAAAGSQSVFERLVKQASGFKLALTAQGEEVPAPFDGSAGAIGFGFWYYEAVMGMGEDCKLLAVDGVKPSVESIASGEYPYVVSCLAGVAESAAEDSPEYILWQWLQGSAGQRLVAAQGCVPAN